MAVSIEIFIMLSIDISNNVKICKVSYCEVNMVSVTSYTYPTETENDNSQFQSQKLRESINTSLESNISKFNTMEQSGLLDNCRTLSKDATFREVFRSLLLYILDSFHIYRHDISDKLVPDFHVTPESENANYKTWIAVTGMDSYTKIEQTGSNKFKVTDIYREFNGQTKCFEQKCRDRDFSGRNVEEFIGLLSAHDRLEKDSNSKLTVAADILKQELAINNRDDRYSLQSEAEKIMMGVLKLVENVSVRASNYPAFVALNGRNNALFADFSEHTFKQNYYILRAVGNNEAGNFKLANFIYTTETNLLNNNTDAGSVIEIKESSSIKRKFPGNVTIEAFN